MSDGSSIDERCLADDDLVVGDPESAGEQAASSVRITRSPARTMSWPRRIFWVLALTLILSVASMSG